MASHRMIARNTTMITRLDQPHSAELAPKAKRKGDEYVKRHAIIKEQVALLGEIIARGDGVLY